MTRDIRISTAGDPTTQPVSYETEELYVVRCGVQKELPGYKSGGPCEGWYVLFFILSGSGVFRVGQQPYPAAKGDILLTRPLQPVSLQADGKQPWRYTWVAFGGDSADTYLEYAGFGAADVIQHSAIPNESYLKIIEEMLQIRESTMTNALAKVSALYHILYLLARNQTSRRQPGRANYDYPREVYVEYAKEYIGYHYAHIKVMDVADYIGVSRSYLTMIFNKVLGQSPQEYLLRFRLEQGAKQLRETDKSLKEIAEAIGYEDAFTFSKIFKSKYGVSPSVYRRERKGAAQ